jgi:proline iminopeptidase
MQMIAVDDGRRLRTWTSGKRGDLPAVVLIHGGPGLWDYLEPVAHMIEPLTLVHRFDQRGCGGSDPSDQHTISRHIADIEALRRHWRHERWIVVGHSFGATLAFAYAATHPERTAAMGYLNGVGIGDWRTDYRAERQRRMTAQQQQRLRALESQRVRNRAEEIEFRTLSWFTDYADPVGGWTRALADAQVDRDINITANRMLVAETDAWSLQDIQRMALELSMPSWFIHGEEDPRPVPTVTALAAMIPRARLHVIERAGHQPWHELPDDLRHLLSRLITTTTTNDASNEQPTTA